MYLAVNFISRENSFQVISKSLSLGDELQQFITNIFINNDSIFPIGSGLAGSAVDIAAHSDKYPVKEC